jgi:hypothetical protein
MTKRAFTLQFLAFCMSMLTKEEIQQIKDECPEFFSSEKDAVSSSTQSERPGSRDS